MSGRPFLFMLLKQMYRRINCALPQGSELMFKPDVMKCRFLDLCFSKQPMLHLFNMSHGALDVAFNLKNAYEYGYQLQIEVGSTPFSFSFSVCYLDYLNELGNTFGVITLGSFRSLDDFLSAEELFHRDGTTKMSKQVLDALKKHALYCVTEVVFEGHMTEYQEGIASSLKSLGVSSGSDSLFPLSITAFKEQSYELAVGVDGVDSTGNINQSVKLMHDGTCVEAVAVEENGAISLSYDTNGKFASLITSNELVLTKTIQGLRNLISIYSAYRQTENL